MRLAELKVPSTGAEPKDPLVVWVICPYPLVALGLGQILEAEVQDYENEEPPAGRVPHLIVLYGDKIEGLSESIKRAQALSPEAPVLVLSLKVELPVALAALKAGAHGFIHAVMEPAQIARAFSVAFSGEMVAPRKLLEFIVSGGVSAATNHRATEHVAFTPRQIEILGLVTEGLNNNEIARHLFLSESTVKQHLRGAYKILGAKNRTEAVRLIRNAG